PARPAEEDQAQQAEGPDNGGRGVELEADVETNRDPREQGKSDERPEHAKHQPGCHFAATENPRGLRTIRTARITTSATRRGKPIDWIQIVGYVSSRPRMKPPSTVRGSETRPPMSAAARASMSSSVRLGVSKLMQ